MSIQSRSRALALLSCGLPGWGHIYWGRERMGLAIFTVFALFAFLLLNGLLISLGGWERVLSGLAAAGGLLVFIAAFLDMCLRSTPARVKADLEMRDDLFRRGMVAYLVDDLKAAEVSFREALTIDPTDVEAFFRLAVVSNRSGDARQAAFWLRRVKRFDSEGKWNWEVKREEKQLAGATR